MADLKKCTPFGIQVKIALIERNMSNHELAEQLGCSNSTISDVMFGRNHSRKTKMRIAEALEIDMKK